MPACDASTVCVTAGCRCAHRCCRGSCCRLRDGPLYLGFSFFSGSSDSCCAGWQQGSQPVVAPWQSRGTSNWLMTGAVSVSRMAPDRLEVAMAIGTKDLFRGTLLCFD